jgi:hypothetical protein
MAWVRRIRVSYIHGLVYISFTFKHSNGTADILSGGSSGHIRLQHNNFQGDLGTMHFVQLFSMIPY